jgi:hypothetical protein
MPAKFRTAAWTSSGVENRNDMPVSHRRIPTVNRWLPGNMSLVAPEFVALGNAEESPGERGDAARIPAPRPPATT